MDDLRGRAMASLGVIVASTLLGLALLVFVDPGIQTHDADELLADRDDARAFLVPDYGFAVLYGVVGPVVHWRFGSALAGGAPAGWVKAAVVLLAVSGAVDLAENTLLWIGTGELAEDEVDLAHAIKPIALVAFPIGALLSFVLGYRAIGVLRSPERWM